jgi:hypothetical protein
MELLPIDRNLTKYVRRAGKGKLLIPYCIAGGCKESQSWVLVPMLLDGPVQSTLCMPPAFPVVRMSVRR